MLVSQSIRFWIKIRQVPCSVPDYSRSDIKPTAEQLLTATSVQALATYCLNNRISFFFDLPLDKKIALLQQTENMLSVQPELPYLLADTLKLSFEQVARWLNKRLLRNLETIDDPKFTTDKVSLLEQELGWSETLSCERSLLLGYILQLPTHAISLWFQRQIPILRSAMEESRAAVEESKAAIEDSKAVLPLAGENPFLWNLDNLIAPFAEFPISRSVAAVVEKRKPNFFDQLPLPVRVTLLKCVRILPVIYHPMVEKLATHLDVSVFNLIAWLSVIHRKYLEINKSSFVPSLRNVLLNDEFRVAPNLSEERALVLSYILEIPFGSLREWFHRRVIHDLLMTVSSERVVSLRSNNFLDKLSAKKYHSMVKRFRRSVSISAAEAKGLALEVELPVSEVLLWFDTMRKFVFALAIEDILRQLTRNAGPREARYLEERYRRDGVVGAVDTFTTRMSEQDVVRWLNWRRMYELFIAHRGHHSVSDEYKQIHSILESDYTRSRRVVEDSLEE